MENKYPLFFNKDFMYPLLIPAHLNSETGNT